MSRMDDQREMDEGEDREAERDDLTQLLGEEPEVHRDHWSGRELLTFMRDGQTITIPTGGALLSDAEAAALNAEELRGMDSDREWRRSRYSA